MAPEVRALGRAHLTGARVLPFVIVTDGDGQWLGGYSGGTTPAAFVEFLQRVAT